MQQKKIWDHFQSEGVKAFHGSGPRLKHLVSKFRRGDRVLNIGVGDGGFESYGIEAGLLVHSLDPSEAAIARLKTECGLGDRAQSGFSDKIPWEDQSFDGVVMSEVLEHLEHDVVIDTLQEVRRVLRSGGGFWGTVPLNEDLQKNAVVCPHCGEKFHRWGHVQAFGFEKITSYLEDAGFRIGFMSSRAFAASESLFDRVKFRIRWALSSLGLMSPGTVCIVFYACRK